MRDILFRGKSFDNGKWVYGDLERSRKTGRCRIHNYDKDGSYIDQHMVVGDTVGMDTGLTDKNGTQIFEGDIVAHNDKPFGIVIWHTNGCFCINDSFDMKERDYTPIGKFFELCYIREHKNTFSVIGNIHDNPEMINQLKTTEK